MVLTINTLSRYLMHNQKLPLHTSKLPNAHFKFAFDLLCTVPTYLISCIHFKLESREKKPDL